MCNQSKLEKIKREEWEREWDKKFEEIDKEIRVDFDAMGLNEMSKDEQIAFLKKRYQGLYFENWIMWKYVKKFQNRFAELKESGII